MSRKAREFSPMNLYHIVMRGTNQQSLHENTWDYEKMVNQVAKTRVRFRFDLHAYCLMSNHTHLLIEADYEVVPKIVQSIKTSYAKYYNKRTDRTGHLFEARYGNVAILSTHQYRNTIRYIHQNPVRARIIDNNNSDKYKWSSMSAFTSNRNEIISESEIAKVHQKFHDISFLEFHKTVSNEGAYEFNEKRISDDEAQKILLEVFGDHIKSMKDIQKMDYKTRNRLLVEFKLLGLTSSQVSRLTGIGRNIVQRAK